MKRSYTFLSMFQPIYVLIAGSIGFAIAKIMFIQWASPFLVKEPGDSLLHVPYPNFMAFLFVVAVFLIFLTIVFLPIWKMLFDLIKESITGRDVANKLGFIVILILGGLSLIMVLLMYSQVTDSIRITPVGFMPPGLNERLNFLIYGAVLTILPVSLISLLIFGNVYELAKKIPSQTTHEQNLFDIAHQLLRYRSLLQNSLLIIGIMASVLPIVTAIIRSALIDLDATGEVAKMWPAIYPIMYGLTFTIILVLFYAPTHLMLTQTGEKLRDTLCPIRDLSEMDKNLKRRKDLDDWLQVNLSLMQNLKAGIVTLAPLITGFVTSIPGLKIF